MSLHKFGPKSVQTFLIFTTFLLIQIGFSHSQENVNFSKIETEFELSENQSFEYRKITKGYQLSNSKSTCRIAVDLGKGKSYGTGTLIAKNEKLALVITAHHLISGNPNPKSIICDFQKGAYPATIVGRDESNDLLALLIYSNSDMVATSISQSYSKSNKLSSFQHPNGNPQQLYQEGGDQGYSRKGDIILNFYSEPGASGSGIFQQDQLVAVLWGSNLGNRTSIATPLSKIQSFLDTQIIPKYDWVA